MAAASGLQSVDSDQAALASEHIDQISEKFSPSVVTTSNLTTVFLSLLVWAAIITAILIGVAFAMFRRWRTRRNAAAAAAEAAFQDDVVSRSTIADSNVVSISAISDGMLTDEGDNRTVGHLADDVESNVGIHVR